MPRWLMLTLAAVPIFLAFLRPAPSPLTWWTSHALVKVRPYDDAPAKPHASVELFAARNEFESFQVIFKAGSQNIQGMDIEFSDFIGPSDSVIAKSNITVYLQRFLELPRPSSIEGWPGEWPDPLIPRIDRYFGEKRNAFPFNVVKGRNQPVWIEVYVPPSALPGTYRGAIAVSVRNERELTIPVTIEVWAFTLPSTSSLTNSFGLNGVTVLRQHLGGYTNDSDLYRMSHTYRKAALWHRISVHGGSMTPPGHTIDGDRLHLDWVDFDAEVGPFLDGLVFSQDEPLFGAKATSMELRTSSGLKTDREKILFWREYANHFKEKKWFDRLFHYVWDEPKPHEYHDLLRAARLVHAADPDLKNMVTTPLKPSWSKEIDIWSPVINCFFPKLPFEPYCGENVERERYNAELATGDTLWWYQACSSHGCFIAGGEYFRGWPSYVIDSNAVANRIMQWMTWKYDVSGELYFNINEAYALKDDAWFDVHAFGGNGDGTLVYPGRPRNIGGTTHIPIESIRLKLIREGLEDYEYLTLLARSAGRKTAAAFVDRIVTNAYTYKRDAESLYDIRRQIAERIAAGR